MALEPEARLRFRAWLVEHDLEPEVADAILETMPPFDWSRIALREDMQAGFDRLGGRFDQVDQRLDRVGAQLGSLDSRVDRVRDSLDTKIDSVGQALGGRLDALNQALVTGGLLLIATMILGLSSVIAAVFVAG